MLGNNTYHKRSVVFFACFVATWMVWASNPLSLPSSASGTPHQVHVAFGFHVNLYHSFRGDTNDENGFGQDIRVIRHTLRALDAFNRRGIPVKAVWDFDNLFSLQELLPTHAPDIITDVQRRVRENKDDVILMSFNNGLTSTMNHPEFMTSIQKAVTNEEGSGVKDLFGRVAPVVRPQEMMTTPGHFERYKEMGIEAVALYHSATPFDAFRLFSRELTPTEAHNPLRFENPRTAEQIVILPTYHPGDLVEQVSLRNWVEKLHRLQVAGTIDRDVLIFINFDADAEFWTGAEVPWHLAWLPNTGGLAQLVDSVADLDFVCFSNLSDYLAEHPPVGTIDFGQDTADGSFHGYHSWAEKAYTSDYWTRIVRNRRVHRAVRQQFASKAGRRMPADLDRLLDRSFELRMRALSTTHFGLASPFLARQREVAMSDLLVRLDETTVALHQRLTAHLLNTIEAQTPPNRLPGGERLVDAFYLFNTALPDDLSGDRRLTFTLPADRCGKGRYVLLDEQGRRVPALVENRTFAKTEQTTTLTLRVPKRFSLRNGAHSLLMEPDQGQQGTAYPVHADTHLLKNEFIQVHLDDRGRIERVLQNGKRQLDANSLTPYIRYKGSRLTPKNLQVTVENPGEDGVATLRLQGAWQGPAGATRKDGWVDYRLRLVRGLPYLFVTGEVQYPDTHRRDLLYPETPMLARKIDAGWEAVAPLELRFSARANRKNPFVIHKRNYLGKEDGYAVNYYRHASQNLNIASINNHITAAYAGVTTAERGMAVALNPQVNANFAFCPFRLDYLPTQNAFAISANPFGTYHGEQVLPPTRGNRQGYEVVRLTAPQLKSAAPTYNGYRQRFDLMIAFFDGQTIPAPIKGDLLAFADRPMAIKSRSVSPPPETKPNPLPPAGFLALPYKGGILFHWDAPGDVGARVQVRYGISSNPGSHAFTASGQTHLVKMPKGLAAGDRVTATIQTYSADGRHSDPSPPIVIPWTDRTVTQAIDAIDLPNTFKARVLGAYVGAWAQRHLF